MIRNFCENDRCVALACRQCGKSTSYTVFCLWYILTNKDKTILICANKFGTAKDILQRIRMAYEELPNWLKPRSRRMEQVIDFLRQPDAGFQQRLLVGSSGRGSSINVLVADEFAFLKPGIEDEFLQSVFPVVSSSKNSKIIIVSTPHRNGKRVLSNLEPGDFRKVEMEANKSRLVRSAPAETRNGWNNSWILLAEIGTDSSRNTAVLFLGQQIHFFHRKH